MDRVAQRWKSTGAWKALERATGKKMFQEPRGNERHHADAGGRGGGEPRRRKGGGQEAAGVAHVGGSENALDAMLAKYYRAVGVVPRRRTRTRPRPSPTRLGAVLLAVVRGKFPGIDFADANARG